jgi:hypothetical protein
VKIPDELPTMFDPFSTGEKMRLFAPELYDAGWLRTKTSPARGMRRA